MRERKPQVMARIPLAEALGDTTPPPATTATAPKAPRKRATAPARAKATTATRTARQATKAAETREPEVRHPKTSEAARVGLYLDKADYDWLRQQPSGDLNRLVRSLIACARADTRLATKVGRLASRY